MKICRKCKEEKEDIEFGKSSKNKDGLHSWCKKCVSVARMETYYKDPSVQRERSALNIQRNQQYVYDYLLEHPCVDCGNADPRVLEFDHVRGIKRNNVAELIKNEYSIKGIQEEIDKCEVRCANCHKLVTGERGGYFKNKLWLASP